MFGRMKNFCIHVENSEKKRVIFRIQIKKEDIRLLSLALSDSTSVIGFWEG